MTRLGVGIVGAGFMGEFHARAYNALGRLYSDLDVALVPAVVCDVREDAARALAERWGIPRWTSDWANLIADKAVDVVDICTPPALHRAVALGAIEARRRAVYCEKPVGLNVAETREMAEASREAEIVSFVGFNYRWIPAISLARQLIENGQLGDLVHVRIFKDTDSAADPKRENWRFFSDYAGGGSLNDVGSHVFDMARSLVGDFRRVNGMTRIVMAERPFEGRPRRVDTDDLWMAMAEFANGASGLFQGSRVLNGQKADFTVEIFGTHGSLRWSQERMNDLDLFETRTDALDGFRTIRLGPQHPDHGRFVPVRGHQLGFADLKTIEAARLAEILAGVRKDSPNFDDALAAASVIDAIPRRQWIDVAPGSTHVSSAVVAP